MGIFPFYEKKETKSEDKLETFTEYAFDFNENKFKLQNGKNYLVYGDEALKIWIYKALITDRFKFLAYSDAFGSEIHTLIGTVRDNDIVKLELKRFIVEALMVNPYIKELSNFKLKVLEGRKIISFDVKTAYEGFSFESEV